MSERNPELDRRIRDRDAALGRLRHTTAIACAGTAALAIAAAGLAAKAFSGKSRHVMPPVVQAHVRPPAVTPPPLVAADSAAPAAPSAPSPPISPPAATPSPPVAVSGGS